MKRKVPKAAEWLLLLSLPPGDREPLLGDFEEFFFEIQSKTNRFRALVWYWNQVFRAVPKIISNHIYWSLIMFKNYFISALRGMLKNKVGFFINIIGLAVAMTCSILIFLYIQDELSFDRFHENSDRICRVVVEEYNRGKWETGVGTPEPLGAALEEEFPEVIEKIRIYHPSWVEKWSVSYQDKTFYEEEVYFSDQSFLDVFTFPLKIGNSKTALNEPNSIVLSASAARKYFGDKNPIGEILTIDDKIDLKITGISDEITHNSHLRFDFLAAFAAMPDEWIMNNWRTLNIYTYLLLDEESSILGLENKLPKFLENHYGKQDKIKLALQPILDIHLYSRNYRNDITTAKGDINLVRIFSIIAVIILLLACINYMNLSTARSSQRALEVGMRKVIGASRLQLIKQFLGESLLFTFIAFILALILTTAFLPLLENLTEKNLSFGQYDFFINTAIVLGICIIVGLAAGSYPAFFLSAFNPIQSMRKNTRIGHRGIYFRRFLVLLQFSISIVLISGTIIVYQQNKYCMKKNMGFNKDQVVVIPMWDTQSKVNYQSFKEKLAGSSNILSVAGSSTIPGKNVGSRGMLPEGHFWAPQNSILVDHDFIPTLGLELTEGRNFSKQFPSDQEDAYIVNQAAVKEFGWENSLGKKLIWRGDKNKKGFVIGVVKDFHFKSLHQKIEPLIMHMSSGWAAYTLVKIRTQEIKNTIAFIRKKWEEFRPNNAFEYFFLDNSFGRLYRSEKKLGTLLEYFTMIALFISCLGLYGLSAYLVEQRTKEIGIRKVLGASISGIVYFFSKDFIKWVLLANFIAWPVAYYFLHKWLQNFVYRIQIRWEVFLAASFLAFIVALITVSYQALLAARTDPVKSLRYE